MNILQRHSVFFHFLFIVFSLSFHFLFLFFSCFFLVLFMFCSFSLLVLSCSFHVLFMFFLSFSCSFHVLSCSFMFFHVLSLSFPFVFAFFFFSFFFFLRVLKILFFCLDCLTISYYSSNERKTFFGAVSGGTPLCKTCTHVSYQQISILTLNFNTSFGGENDECRDSRVFHVDRVFLRLC